jgi:hypothetical protein
MRRDPLAVLLRLRGVETLLARRRLAEDLAAGAAAETKAEAARVALGEEARSAGGADHAAWLPRGLAERDRAVEETRRAGARAVESATALGTARAAERAVERLAETRAAEARREAVRREQVQLDEAGAQVRLGSAADEAFQASV